MPNAALLLIVALLAQAPAAKPAPAPKAIDPCALIADADVRAVLGQAVKQRRPGTQHAGGLQLAECYVGTGTARSISIAVAEETSPGTTSTARAFWRSQFHARPMGAREANGPRGKSARTSEERDETHEDRARPIRGVGDEAFWSGTRVAGALYVLSDDTFIRVSVGGINDEQARIEKSRQLARFALARLRQHVHGRR